MDATNRPGEPFADPPVFDTSDLPALASLAELSFPDRLAEEMGELLFEGGDPARYGVLRDRERYVTWNNGARRLAAAGVRPGPSHHRWRDDPRTFSSVWGAFFGAEDLAAERNEMLGHPAGFPLVLYGLALPDGFDPAQDPLPFQVPLGWGWAAVTHQTGGQSCRRHGFVGFALQVRPEQQPGIARLARFPDRSGEHACVTRTGPGTQHLGELAAYHTLVGELGLACDWSHDALEEGLYPLDATCAGTLSEMSVPTEEEFLAVARTISETPWADLDVARPAIYVFGSNCE